MRHKHNYQSFPAAYLQHPRTGQIYRLELAIDVSGLLDILGSKAMNSKGHEARECNGDVRVRAYPVETGPKNSDEIIWV
jgi:hypothetical protein